MTEARRRETSGESPGEDTEKQPAPVNGYEANASRRLVTRVKRLPAL